MPYKNFEQFKLDMLKRRPREEIINDLQASANTEELTRKLILEILLDIRDLLDKKE